MKLKMVLGLVLFLMSFQIFAETYPAISGNCDSFNAQQDFPWCTPSVKTQSGGMCWKHSSSGSFCDSAPVPTSSCPGGGTKSGSNCINAPACSSGESRDLVTGICGAAPCTAGTAKAISTKTASTDSASHIMTIELDAPTLPGTQEAPVTTCIDGCMVSYNAAQSTGAYDKNDANGTVYSNYDGVATGATCTTNGASNGTPVTPEAGDVPSKKLTKDSAGKNCLMDKRGASNMRWFE